MSAEAATSKYNTGSVKKSQTGIMNFKSTENVTQFNGIMTTEEERESRMHLMKREHWGDEQEEDGEEDPEEVKLAKIAKMVSERDEQIDFEEQSSHSEDEELNKGAYEIVNYEETFPAEEEKMEFDRDEESDVSGKESDDSDDSSDDSDDPLDDSDDTSDDGDEESDDGQGNKQHYKNQSNSSSESDDDDTESKSDSSDSSTDSDSDAKSDSPANGTKKMKVKMGASKPPIPPAVANKRLEQNSISVEAVRRALKRKPMTATQLIAKFRNKRAGMSGTYVVQMLHGILMKIDPNKEIIQGKMYLWIKNDTEEPTKH
ncbi:general transcription factor IIF subunit 1-like [Scaptodrosophila lebanonensis]|uniref:Transcription initiation factor IIF subunit alpha n=1 Tax=Drosophila lebanonensis TaxID=7225 RepID=A0A6J2UD63_DROLE|nr:general transcription factor IIF subunit 1-like [Scaptodrosophila lebanonensis]